VVVAEGAFLVLNGGVMKELKEAIAKALRELELAEVVYELDHPREEGHGDYSTNVALKLAKQVGESPRELAAKIKDLIDSDIEVNRLINKVEVAGAGFVNFFLKDEVLVKQVEEVIVGKGKKSLTGKKYAVEYTDPNPFKEFHIGHLYSNLIGESIARLYEANGAEVWRGDFYGDVGMHIAKSVWGMIKKMDREGVKLSDLEEKPIKERQQFMGQGYAEGTIEYEKDERVKEEIKDMNYMIYVASQEVLVRERGWKPLVNYERFIEGNREQYPRVKEVYQAGLKWSLAYFETYYARLGTKFDGYYPESYVGELGLKEVEKGLAMGVLSVGEEGAVVYEGERDGLHTRVFRNKMGLPTYEAKDLGLVKAKYADFAFDYSLNVFGKEIDEYYKVVKRAMEQIEPELGKKQEHLAHGMVNVPEGKMSSRKGNVITVEWLLNQARDRAYQLINNESLGEEEKQKVAEQVGQGAVKYALLKSNIGDNVTFDFGQSVSFEGASGPYIQYTYARARSVVEKAEEVGSELGEGIRWQGEERGIMRTLSRYAEVVEKAAREKSPSTLAMYLYELAARFNGFYNGSKIAGETRRIWLTEQVTVVLRRGLEILGIQSPEKM